MPISLTHGVENILGKFLANHIAPEMQNNISTSFFFLFFLFFAGVFRITSCMCRILFRAISHHRAKKQSIFLKLYIVKAFDSVNWDYLLEVLAQVGFSQCCSDLIAISLASTTSRILLKQCSWDSLLPSLGTETGRPPFSIAFACSTHKWWNGDKQKLCGLLL